MYNKAQWPSASTSTLDHPGIWAMRHGLVPIHVDAPSPGCVLAKAAETPPRAGRRTLPLAGNIGSSVGTRQLGVREMQISSRQLIQIHCPGTQLEENCCISDDFWLRRVAVSLCRVRLQPSGTARRTLQGRHMAASATDSRDAEMHGVEGTSSVSMHCHCYPIAFFNAR